ncbi:MAG: hypothetical protein D6814_14260 [Calditrichaeota bacterium]|nr:MAG: hypothetical protein D6814_14260 [Calditrichota bacterium]
MKMIRTFLTFPKSLLILCSLILATFRPVHADSIFSQQGIGLNRYYTSVASVGMGGAGIASFNPFTLHYMNPAALSFFKLTRFDGSMLIENINVKLPNQTGRFANSNFNSIQVAIPLKTGYAIGFGLQPYSLVAFELSGPVETPAYRAMQTLEGSGSVTRGFLRFGGRIGKNFAYGLGMDVYFGRIQRTWRLNFETSGFRNTRDQVSSYIRGLSGHIGVIAKLSAKLNAGAVVYFPATLDYTTDITLVFGPRTDMTEGKVKLPLSHGYGINYHPSNKWQLVADVFLQSWGDIAPEDIFNAQTANTVVGAVGAEYTPTLDQTKFLIKRMSYRVGFRTRKLPYLDTNGEAVHENVFTFGVTLPYYFYRSKIDFGFEVGKRGSLSKNTAEETIFRMVVGFTSGEKWFKR